MKPMRTWWREEPLSPKEQYLFEALFEAHHESCFRPNVSTITVSNCAAGSNDMASAIAAAILATGGKHAPLERTYQLLSLDNPALVAGQTLKDGFTVDGWGNSFIKEGPDELWSTVDSGLKELYPELYNKISAVTVALHKLGKKLYPNPSAYTAAVAIALGVPRKAAVYLFISARLDAWSSIALNQLEGAVKPSDTRQRSAH